MTLLVFFYKCDLFASILFVIKSLYLTDFSWKERKASFGMTKLNKITCSVSKSLTFCLLKHCDGNVLLGKPKNLFTLFKNLD